MAETASLIFYPPAEPFKVGELEFDVLVKSELHYSMDVTENPVEGGFVIADHVIQKPFKLSVTAIVSPIPVTWYDRFGGASVERITTALDELKRLYEEREPMTIITMEAIYEDMVLTDAVIPIDDTGKQLVIPMEFTHIITVDNELTDIPEEYVSALDAGKAGMSKQEAGAAATADATTGANITTGEQTQDAMTNTDEVWESDLHKWFGKK